MGNPKQTLHVATVFLVLLTCLCLLVYRAAPSEVTLTLAITFGTFSYHLCMRLLVGALFNLLLHNHVDYNRRWFHVGEREMAIYQRLGVRQWKNHMPTYDASTFDIHQHSLDEVAQTMCQAELVHETIAVLSLVPILASRWLGALPVFVVTSLLAATIDLSFVVIQRYNRPRLLKIMRGRKGRADSANRSMG